MATILSIPASFFGRCTARFMSVSNGCLSQTSSGWSEKEDKSAPQMDSETAYIDNEAATSVCLRAPAKVIRATTLIRLGWYPVRSSEKLIVELEQKGHFWHG
jgi:hypothetical protein